MTRHRLAAKKKTIYVKYWITHNYFKTVHNESGVGIVGNSYYRYILIIVVHSVHYVYPINRVSPRIIRFIDLKHVCMYVCMNIGRSEIQNFVCAHHSGPRATIITFFKNEDSNYAVCAA